MSNENDSKILTLKKQIIEKRNMLDKIKKRFSPVTNCSIELEGERYNLNVLQKEQLIFLMVRLNTHRLSAADLGILDDYVISGYKIEDWITDIKAKLEVISRVEEERKLKVMEDKLTQLLSNEKKVELEIDEIASLLK